MTELTFGSLFSGIGGFDLGFKRAGMRCAWQVEIDQKCQDVLRRNLPGAEIYDDVTTVGKHNLAAVDVVCGGFPCQDLSVAGRRAGLAGERSGLWFEFHRILTEARPGWVVIENVPGLLSSNGGRDFAIILRGLGDLGYLTAWRVLDAQYFGVAQRRRRVFIVGHLGDGRAAQVLFEREGGGWDTPPRREAGKGIAHAVSASPTATGRLDPNGQDFVCARSTGAGWYTEDDKASLRAEPGGTTFDLVAYTIQQNDGGDHKRKDRPNGGMYVNEAKQSLTVGGTDQTVIATGWDAQRARIHDADGIAPSLQSGAKNSGNIIPAIAFTQNTRDEVRQINGDGQIAGALGAEPGMKQQTYIAWHGAQITSPQNMGGVFEDVTPTVNSDPRLMVGVRRLTPVECERLQGFPDGWTDHQADSTRYRQLGNAVAVPCAEWIARKIMEADSERN